jgi:hypothetical protein
LRRPAVNYREQVAEARRRRDELTERAAAEARETIARAAAERDSEIHRLHAEGRSAGAIAPLVGCSKALAYELMSDDRKARYNERRRRAWHLRAVA